MASPKPLSGLKVLDLSRVLAGPFAGQLLADLGADVIKVESPQGDDTRRWGPPFIDRDDGSRDAAYFHSCNRGKRSLVADLKNIDDLRRIESLIARADVVLENFKVGGLKQFGLDHATLCARHPGLIYCSITGFGHSGPKSHQAGYDIMIQGLSGIMSITGEADGPPQKMGVAFADVFTGLYSVIAIQAALSERGRSGLGQFIDMALFDTMTAVLVNQAMNHLTSGTAPQRMGNAHPNIVPYQAFAVADGYVIVAVGNDGQFRRFCQVLERDDLAHNARYQTNPDRVRHRSSLIPELETELQTWQRDRLLAALEAATVPCGPIHDVGEAINDPQLQHRGMVLEREGIPGLASPIHFGTEVLASELASPTLGNTSFDDAEKLFGRV
ncbi:CaiB/BaiF CoA-transferase family protein [Pararhizobium sp. IMCC21322]|uniref:CaiB/BaiF CoA transferase family protein n=1 Tax=Pararhizobium sp. IMCC21322 TaxID=3067903 RepID=UPI0027422F54|nr:CaiB/BaiF CoA-transferase family protein [Pararhizobium sp. IMCC21322]